MHLKNVKIFFLKKDRKQLLFFIWIEQKLMELTNPPEFKNMLQQSQLSNKIVINYFLIKSRDVVTVSSQFLCVIRNIFLRKRQLFYFSLLVTLLDFYIVIETLKVFSEFKCFAVCTGPVQVLFSKILSTYSHDSTKKVRKNDADSNLIRTLII